MGLQVKEQCRPEGPLQCCGFGEVRTLLAPAWPPQLNWAPASDPGHLFRPVQGTVQASPGSWGLCVQRPHLAQCCD